MAWELLAIWAIVIMTATWFIRDEKRLRNEAEVKSAGFDYTHAPQYRHIPVEPIDQPATAPYRRPAGLRSEQRAFIEALAASKASDNPMKSGRPALQALLS